MVYKRGRYGEFEACSNYPTCKYIKKKPREGDELIGKPTGDKCPNCGADVVWKRGRFGLFKACSNYPECKTIIKTPKEKK